VLNSVVFLSTKTGKTGRRFQKSKVPIINQLAKPDECFCIKFSEIRSIERGICPIAVLNFVVKHSLILKTLLVYNGTNVTTFWVMWRHRSRDHKIHSGYFPIGGLLTPTLYLAQFLRYWASNISGHDLDRFGRVTSSVTWPLDPQWVVSYRWSIDTNPLSRIVTEILCVIC